MNFVLDPPKKKGSKKERLQKKSPKKGVSQKARY
ncbi:hypothetical protein L935_07360 [Helicobacter pylori PZ5086]|nr:hypothetical protein L935_07360 [Helicobacter pylori PZ5086]